MSETEAFNKQLRNCLICSGRIRNCFVENSHNSPIAVLQRSPTLLNWGLECAELCFNFVKQYRVEVKRDIGELDDESCQTIAELRYETFRSEIINNYWPQTRDL
jgi:hypothetical protein